MNTFRSQSSVRNKTKSGGECSANDRTQDNALWVIKPQRCQYVRGSPWDSKTNQKKM